MREGQGFSAVRRDQTSESLRNTGTPLCQIIIIESEKKYSISEEHRISCVDPTKGGITRGSGKNHVNSKTAWLLILALPLTNTMNLGRWLDSGILRCTLLMYLHFIGEESEARIS